MFFSVKLLYFCNKIAITTKPINSTFLVVYTNFFYRKLRPQASKQFLKFSVHFNDQSFLRVSYVVKRALKSLGKISTQVNNISRIEANVQI